MDKLNEALLKRVLEHPHSSIRSIIRPCLAQKSENALRGRVKNLAAFGYIALDADSVPNRILCTITRKGRDYLVDAGVVQHV